jgi:hypothetical protein
MNKLLMPPFEGLANTNNQRKNLLAKEKIKKKEKTNKQRKVKTSTQRKSLKNKTNSCCSLSFRNFQKGSTTCRSHHNRY